MKNASWVLAFLFGILFLYAFSQVPPEGEASLSSHISIRYSQQSKVETGIQSPVGAVLADYRGFDLLASGALFFAALLFLYLFFREYSGLKTFVPMFCGLSGLVLALGVGVLSLLHGSNFLDYEALASWVASPQARSEGALMLTGGVLLGLGGFLLLAIQWVQSREGSNDS